MIPENCYVNQQELEPFSSGIRIDYVLFKVSITPPPPPWEPGRKCPWGVSFSPPCPLPGSFRVLHLLQDSEDHNRQRPSQRQPPL